MKNENKSRRNETVPRILQGDFSSEWRGVLAGLWGMLGGGADVFDTLEGVVSKAVLPQPLGVISEYCLVGQHDLQKEFGFSE